ncbi:hypothetical protein G6F58_013676 [Rhizopus delemar]|nr:hypothetical protein G6F24_018842 [Rhizopus arrhizus]KAG1387297.1 hypothetical protein G6F58_013676 [Rhizopus delemar]
MRHTPAAARAAWRCSPSRTPPRPGRHAPHTAHRAGTAHWAAASSRCHRCWPRCCPGTRPPASACDDRTGGTRCAACPARW